MSKLKLLALIRAAECIGCMKCIQACPVDAIIGTAKHMHTVITDECIGCKLCVAPCPVDCIDMVPHPEQTLDKELVHTRIQFRKQRLHAIDVEKKRVEVGDKKNYVIEALQRVRRRVN